MPKQKSLGLFLCLYVTAIDERCSTCRVFVVMAITSPMYWTLAAARRTPLFLFFTQLKTVHTMQTTITLLDPHSIRVYFQKVLQLRNSGVDFPVDLDEVWPLAYARKDNAVKILKKTFIEGIDFQPLRQKAKQVHGGQNKEDFKLSVACLEYFIARKVREVFEVYRQVFHAVKDSIQPAVEKLQREVTKLRVENETLRKVIDSSDRHHEETRRHVEFLNGHCRWLNSHADNVQAELTKMGEKYISQLDKYNDLTDKYLSLQQKVKQGAADQPKATLPELSKVTMIHRMVRNYIGSGNHDYRAVYNWLYLEMRDRYHIDPTRWKIPKDSSIILEIEKRGHIDQLYAIAENLLGQKVAA